MGQCPRECLLFLAAAANHINAFEGLESYLLPIGGVRNASGSDGRKFREKQSRRTCHQRDGHERWTIMRGGRGRQHTDTRAGLVMPPMPCGFVKKNWLWDANDLCPSVELSHGRKEVYFHTDPVSESGGTAGVRGDEGFLQGEHYWEIEFLEPPSGLSVMVGVGTSRAALCAGSFQYINLLGLDADSWGLSYKGNIWHGGSSRQYTEPFYEAGTLIGLHLNMEDGTLTFYKDRESLGVAFTGLHKVQLPLFPMASSTSPGTEMALGLRCCTLPSLEERCLSTLARNLTRKDSADLLPLPDVVRWKLKSWKNCDAVSQGL